MPGHSMIAIEKCDAAHFTEQDSQTKASESAKLTRTACALEITVSQGRCSAAPTL
jgi:hypothetical protein